MATKAVLAALLAAGSVGQQQRGQPNLVLMGVLTVLTTHLALIHQLCMLLFSVFYAIGVLLVIVVPKLTVVFHVTMRLHIRVPPSLISCRCLLSFAWRSLPADHSLKPELARLYETDREGFNKAAREHTKQHAM
jgi:hypothetical protein